MKNVNVDDRVIVLGILVCVLIIIGSSVFLGFSADKATNKSAEQTATNDEMLVVIEDHALTGYYIVYDKDTKIIYYQGVSHGACLDPLYNSDGTLKLYNGGN